MSKPTHPPTHDGGPNASPRIEQRDVRVEDPALTTSANERLTGEVRRLVGESTVNVPADRAHPSKGERASSDRVNAVSSGAAILALIIALMLIVIGAIVSATAGSWWFMGLAVLVDAVGLGVVATFVIRVTSATEHPDPTTVAMLEEQGIVNADGYYSEIVAEFTEPAADDSSGNHRATAVEDDPLQAAAEQKSATTATGGRSAAVGPGAP